MTHPYTPETHPDWAIEEAMERSGIGISVSYIKANTFLYPQTLAHAYDIARHEKPPVDKAALVLADYYEGLGWPSHASRVREGKTDPCAAALRAALLKNGIEI